MANKISCLAFEQRGFVIEAARSQIQRLLNKWEGGKEHQFVFIVDCWSRKWPYCYSFEVYISLLNNLKKWIAGNEKY